MVRLLAQVRGLGIETGGMLVHELLARPLRDRRAVARSADLTGPPTRAASDAGRRVSRAPATRVCAAR